MHTVQPDLPPDQALSSQLILSQARQPCWPPNLSSKPHLSRPASAVAAPALQGPRRAPRVPAPFDEALPLRPPLLRRRSARSPAMAEPPIPTEPTSTTDEEDGAYSP